MGWGPKVKRGDYPGLYKIHPYEQVQFVCKPFVFCSGILGVSLVFLDAVSAYFFLTSKI